MDDFDSALDLEADGDNAIEMQPLLEGEFLGALKSRLIDEGQHTSPLY